MNRAKIYDVASGYMIAYQLYHTSIEFYSNFMEKRPVLEPFMKDENSSQDSTFCVKNSP
ncbi:uncharacterized protein DS421_17g573760 [Arachis hypogaea]|nr:uncharacterized protein DS421_17g573760 [Arachis hypogaea]